MSFHDDYYDTASILAEEEIVPVRFLVAADGLGYLNPHGDNEDTISEGTTIELPFWLAKELRGKDIVEIGAPKIFSQNARAHLKADPSVVSLRSSGDFYQIGAKYGELSGDAELRPGSDSLLVQVFAARQPEIMNRSQTWANEDFSRFVGKLTHVEQQLFFAGRAAAIDFAGWRRSLRSSSSSSSSSAQQAAKRPRRY